MKLSFKKWFEVASQGAIVNPVDSTGTQKATQNLGITHSAPGSSELPPNSKEQYHFKDYKSSSSKSSKSKSSSSSSSSSKSSKSKSS